MPTTGKSANSPRRKPKQARARDTVEVVLDAAAQVLARHGYAGATTNRIAEVAGVSIGTVYEYFSNKEGVFEALIERELGALAAAFQVDDVDWDADLETAIQRLISAGMGAMRHGPELFRALEAVPGARFRLHLGAAREGVIGLIKRLLESHRGALRVTDLDLAAFIIVNAVEGVAANATRPIFDAHLANELSALVSLYLTGACAEKPRIDVPPPEAHGLAKQ